MRATINIVDRENLLDTLEEWSGSMFNDEFESNKFDLEARLAQFEAQLAPYRSVAAPVLYRGTGGVSKTQITSLRKGKSLDIDLSEFGMASWSKDLNVSIDFADKYNGIVIKLPTSSLDVFLDIQQFWADMTEEEKRVWRSIGVANDEQEVIVKMPTTMRLTADLIAWPDLSAQPKATAPSLSKMTPGERRELLAQRAAVAHPNHTADDIAKRVYDLSDQKVFELLKTSYAS